MPQAAGSSTTVDGGRTEHSFLPLFDRHSQSYQQWVKGTKIYHLKLNVYNKLSEDIVNIMHSLQRKTWCLVVSFVWQRWWNFFNLIKYCHGVLMETFRLCLESQDKSSLYPSTTMTRSCDPATAANSSDASWSVVSWVYFWKKRVCRDGMKFWLWLVLRDFYASNSEIRWQDTRQRLTDAVMNCNACFDFMLLVLTLRKFVLIREEESLERRVKERELKKNTNSKNRCK